MPANKSLSVSEFTFLLKSHLEESWPKVSIVGEVSQPKQAASGHLYFTLKDNQAALSCVAWKSTVNRLKHFPQHGDEVELSGAIKVYPPRGSYQLEVRTCHLKGQGNLEVKFQKLKEKLTKQGVFDSAKKKQLPFLPKRIALITSPTGAARHDMEKSIRDRFPVADLVFIGCSVQGGDSVVQLVKAIQQAQTIQGVEVVVIGRGGGSLEDLWSFNEEMVVRAIATCQVPIVSAVGHEIDVTLADFAADARALTPTAVGALIVPEWNMLWQNLDDNAQRLNRSLKNALEGVSWRLKSVRQSRAWNRPKDHLHEKFQQVDELRSQLQKSTKNKLEKSVVSFQLLLGQIKALNPLQVLKRGFSVAILEDGSLLKAAKAKQGDQFSLRLEDGTIQSVVREVVDE